MILGNPLKKEPTIIVGAGISGLFLAYYLKKKDIPVTVYEKNSKAGGLLGSKQTALGFHELSANTFLWCKELGEMAQHLGLDIIAPKKEAKKRYFYVNDKLKNMPIPVSAIPKALNGLFFKKGVPPKTLEEFGNQYFGETITKRIITPAFNGIYGAESSALGFEAVMPAFHKGISEGKTLFQSLKSRPKVPKGSPKGSHAYKGGFQALVDALVKYIGDDLIFREPTSDELSNKQVVYCTPAHVNAKLFPSFQATFDSIEYRPFVTITVIADGSQLPKLKPGFGVLFPKEAATNFLGILFNHSNFYDRVVSNNLVSMTLIGSLKAGIPMMEFSDAELRLLVKEDLSRVLGMTGDFLEIDIYRWAHGIPVYSPQLPSTLKALNENLQKQNSPMRFFGNYTGEISIRGMCQVASKAVEEAFTSTP